MYPLFTAFVSLNVH